jgi:hypothetical protein
MDVACGAPSVLGGQDDRPRWWPTAAGGGEDGWGHFTLVAGGPLWRSVFHESETVHAEAGIGCARSRWGSRSTDGGV